MGEDDNFAEEQHRLSWVRGRWIIAMIVVMGSAYFGDKVINSLPESERAKWATLHLLLTAGAFAIYVAIEVACNFRRHRHSADEEADQ